jgi:hypothetical protein
LGFSTAAGGFLAFFFGFSFSKSPASVVQAASADNVIAKTIRRETDDEGMDLMSLAGRPVLETGAGKD